MSFDISNENERTENTVMSEAETTDAVADSPAVTENDDPFASFAEPHVRTKENLTAARKKKKTLLVVSLIGAFLVLVTVLILLLVVFPEKSDPDDSTQTEDTTITLLDKTTTAVSTAVKSAILQNDSMMLELTNQDDTALIKGYEDLPISTDNMDALLDALTLYTATQDIGEQEALADFGFDNPTLIATVTFYDDSTYSFEIGALAPDQSGYYFREKDSHHLYILPADSVYALLQEPLSYVSTTVFKQPETSSEDGEIVLRNMKLSGSSRLGKEFAFRLVTSADDSAYLYHTYIITYPFQKGASTSKASEIQSFTYLTADAVAAVHPTAAQLGEFGLDDPTTVAEFTLAERTTVTGPTDADGNASSETKYSNLQEHTLRLGKLYNGYYYCTVDDMPIVYLVSADSIPFATLQYDEFTDSLLFLENITNIASMKVPPPAGESNFQLTHYPDISDNDKNLTVTADGNTYDTMNFRYLMQNFMNISRYGSLDKSVEGLPLKLSFSYTLNGESEPDFTADFYELSSSIYAAVLSNGERYTVKASKVENVIKQYQNLLNGEKVLY